MINKIKAFLNGLNDPAYLIIQIRNYLSKGVALDRKHYYFFNNFFKIILIKTSKKEPLIIDVGSNDGWFLRVVNRFSPSAKVICIEPLSFLISKLESLSKNISNEVNIYNFALGDQPLPNVEIYQYESHGISSILELEENNTSYIDKGKGLNLVEKVSVEQTTLDILSIDFPEWDGPKVLKIDTQGYELKVLSGGGRLISENYFDYIVLEVMTFVKYKDSPLFHEIYKFLDERGYSLISMLNSCNETNGWTSEFDVIFVSKNHSY